MQGDCNYFICNCEGIAITNQFLFNMKNPTKYIHGEFKIIGWKPLRYKLTAIRSEKLLDITRSGIKKSGFKNKKEFMEFFNKNNSKKRAEAFYENIGGKTWNPEVWVLTIKKEAEK